MIITRAARWLADYYAWTRWMPLLTWSEFRAVANACRAMDKPVYSRGLIAWLGNR